MAHSVSTKKIVRKRNKRFIRHQSDRFDRVDKSWRKPKGIDSRVRRRFKGQLIMPSIGFGTKVSLIFFCIQAVPFIWIKAIYLPICFIRLPIAIGARTRRTSSDSLLTTFPSSKFWWWTTVSSAQKLHMLSPPESERYCCNLTPFTSTNRFICFRPSSSEQNSWTFTSPTRTPASEAKITNKLLASLLYKQASILINYGHRKLAIWFLCDWFIWTPLSMR